MESDSIANKLDYILKESVGIFLKYGIRSVSMDDIARELGISKKTLYQHVSNKAELISKILDSDEFHSKCLENFDNPDTNAIDELLEISVQVSKDLKKYSPSAIYDLHKYYPEVIKPFMERRRSLVLDFIRANIIKGIRQDIYRTDLDVELIALLYIKKLESTHEMILNGDVNYTLEQILSVMFENHIRGICNEAGIRHYENQKSKFQI